MHQKLSAAYLWAYDLGSRLGINWRPKTILLVLLGSSILFLVPSLAVGLWAGRMLAALEVSLPWGTLAAVWALWGAVRITITQKREELTASGLAPLLRAIDLGLPSWFCVRFAVPAFVEAIYVFLAFSGLMWGGGAAEGDVISAFAVLIAGYAARLGLMAQLAVRYTGFAHLALLLLIVGTCLLAGSITWPKYQLLLLPLLLGIAILLIKSINQLAKASWWITLPKRHRAVSRKEVTLPSWYVTTWNLRRGTWVPPLRSAILRLIILSALTGGFFGIVRLSFPQLNELLRSVPQVANNGLVWVAFLISLTLGSMGVTWFGVRSRRYQLRLAWECGAKAAHLGIGSALAHVPDGVAMTFCLGFVSATLGVMPEISMLILPIETVLATALGYALFATPELPDGSVRTSLLGTIVGFVLAIPALLMAINPTFYAISTIFVMTLFGGLSWVSMQVIKKASYSMM